jgi:hypothetical protein
VENKRTITEKKIVEMARTKQVSRGAIIGDKERLIGLQHSRQVLTLRLKNVTNEIDVLTKKLAKRKNRDEKQEERPSKKKLLLNQDATKTKKGYTGFD